MNGTYKRAVMVERGKIEIQEAPIPTPSSEQVLVRQHACAICTNDIRRFLAPTGFPTVSGHESAGVIEAVGDDVPTGLKVGQKVALVFSIGVGLAAPVERVLTTYAI
jgi:L-iditol 2-dehydrogenase